MNHRAPYGARSAQRKAEADEAFTYYNGGPRVVPWKDGDARTHCTHCECCGLLFRTVEIEQHEAEAHLGGREQEQAHLREGARLLARGVELDTVDGTTDAQIEEYAVQLAEWLKAEETRQKEVRGG